MTISNDNLKPSFRKLKGYAFDPSLSLNNSTSIFNEVIYKVPWEDLRAGPSGQYIEVIDYDPTIPNGEKDFGRFYSPVDLNNPYILAQDGLTPSDSNPQFHQQMVYAVAMKTIKNFEKALGRKIIWRERKSFMVKNDNPNVEGEYRKASLKECYVEKLRIYPHALREPNAYYSPMKRALLFGYFRSTPTEKHVHMPNSWVFTCLSHDIIAHEVTHAILDGLNKYYTEPTNPDVLAFHEAFADIVALFQHFTMPEVLKSQIAKTKGNLENQNLLGQLAQEFGNAIGGYGSLRDAIGKVDPTDGEWKRIEPDPSEYETIYEPHKRGAILVAAVFDAFLSLYKHRVSDLMRIATGGTGVLPDGEIHPDLVNRLANEAAKTAKHMLNICIRAIDYCPPVDITFGEYLRAIITADCDLVSEDSNGYRLAFIDAFKRRGIYPTGIKTLSIDSLKYDQLEDSKSKRRELSQLRTLLKDYSLRMKFRTERDDIYTLTKVYIAGDRTKNKGLHRKLTQLVIKDKEFGELMGILTAEHFKELGINQASFKYKDNVARPSFAVTNLREISRVGPTGKKVNQILFTVIQTARLIVDPENKTYRPAKKDEEGTMKFRGGTSIIFDLDTLSIKYSIRKSIFNGSNLDNDRLWRQYKYQYDKEMTGMTDMEKYFGLTRHADLKETFALLHNH